MLATVLKKGYYKMKIIVHLVCAFHGVGLRVTASRGERFDALSRGMGRDALTYMGHATQHV